MPRIPRPVLWHQGLFLQPQHFQQMERNIEYRFSPLLSYIKPHLWGITKLVIDNSALEEGYFKIDELEVLFQDGSWVTFPGNARVSSRHIEDIQHELETKDSFQIYIGLAKWDYSTANVQQIKDEETTNGSTRFISPLNPEEVEDIHSNGPHASIRFMNYVVKIFWETEIEDLGNYSLIPIARLKKDGAKVVLSNSFIPPLLCINGSNGFKQIISGIRDQILSRLEVLEGYKLSREIAPSELTGNSIRYIMALMVLNKYLPLLDHLIGAGTVHPWEIYGVLRQLIGELSSFTERINATGRTPDGNELISGYNHGDIGNCFSKAGLLIEELLNAIIVGAENIIKLIREEDDFVAQIPPEILEEKNLFCIVLNTKSDRESVIDAFEHIVKVSSKETMPTLLSRALPGISLTHRKTPPPGIPADPDSYFFMLHTNDPLWLELKRTGNFCLHWDNAPEDVKGILVVSKF